MFQRLPLRSGRRLLCPLLLVLSLGWGVLACGRRPAEPNAEPITFNKHIVRLFQQHCQECHRPASVAPFSLTTYRDAYPWRSQILDATRARRMPPWKPVAGHGEFRNVRRLSEADLALIAAWVQAGAPEGAPRDLPPPRDFSTRWALGDPDLILTPRAPFSIQASTRDVYRCFTIETTLPERRWVSAVEMAPSNRRIVHHLMTYLDTSGRKAEPDRGDASGIGYSCFGSPGVVSSGSFGGWMPGAGPLVMPQGVGIELPAGTRVVLQVHYHNHGTTAQTDRTAIGLHFAKDPVTKPLRELWFGSLTFVVPAGAARYEVTASYTVPPGTNLHAIAIVPHMHLLGREIKVTATYPDGAVRPLVYVDDWDFNWQDFYYYVKPVPLPAGTRLDLSCIYDNSFRNLRNPNSPPRNVSWGEGTADEMCVSYFQVTNDAEAVGGQRASRDSRPLGDLAAPGNRLGG